MTTVIIYSGSVHNFFIYLFFFFSLSINQRKTACLQIQTTLGRNFCVLSVLIIWMCGEVTTVGVLKSEDHKNTHLLIPCSPGKWHPVLSKSATGCLCIFQYLLCDLDKGEDNWDLFLLLCINCTIIFSNESSYLCRVWTLHVGLGAVCNPTLQDLLNPGHKENFRMRAGDRKHSLPGVLQSAFQETNALPVAGKWTLVSTVDTQVLSTIRAWCHFSDKRVVEIHVEVSWDLPAVLDIE